MQPYGLSRIAFRGGTGASQIELLIGKTMCFVVEILYFKAI